MRTSLILSAIAALAFTSAAEARSCTGARDHSGKCAAAGALSVDKKGDILGIHVDKKGDFLHAKHAIRRSRHCRHGACRR